MNRENLGEEHRIMGEFLHELKTPLAIIRSHLESELGNEAIPLEVRKTLVLDVEEIARMTTLVNEMKTIVECSSRQCRFAPASLVALLVDAIEFLEPLSAEKGQQIAFVAAENIVLEMDGPKMKQLCFNLIQNAIKYTPEKGKIEVTAEALSDRVVLTVRDDGIGIPPEEQEKVFNRFYRVHPNRSEGSGLGLSICAAVASLHGGTIELESAPGEGSRFTVTLPKERP